MQAFSVFVFEFTGFLPSRQETTKRSGVLVHEVLGLALGLSVPIPVACSLVPGVPPPWAKALFSQEGAHGWLVDDKAAFSGAAKLRLLRGGVELGPGRRPTGEGTQGYGNSAWQVWCCCLPAGPNMMASGWNHAFASFAVSHGSPVVVGSCCLAGFLLPAFLGCLTALAVAPGAAGHCRQAVMPVPEGGTTHPRGWEEPTAFLRGPWERTHSLGQDTPVPTSSGRRNAAQQGQGSGRSCVW